MVYGALVVPSCTRAKADLNVLVFSLGIGLYLSLYSRCSLASNRSK